MDNDDLPVGRILSRRETLALFGMTASALLAACGGGNSGTATAIGGGAQPTTGATRAAGSAAQPTTGAAAAPATQPAGSATARGAEAATAANRSSVASQVAAVGTSAAASAGAACIVTPEMTIGPYFVDEKLNRSDIRSDPTDGTVKAGVPLAVTFNLLSVTNGACTPIAGATVDVWQCDAAGIYSDVTDTAIGFNTKGKKFLRGYQTTDASGTAKFTTIYPGWYSGRTVHIHFKILTTGTNGQSYEFTSQLFFPETLTDQVFAQAPYASKGKRDTTNAADMVYANGGSQTLLAPTPAGDGYAAMIAVGLNLADTNVGRSDVGTGGGPGGPGGGPPPGGLPPGGSPPSGPPGARGTGTPTG